MHQWPYHRVAMDVRLKEQGVEVWQQGVSDPERSSSYLGKLCSKNCWVLSLWRKSFDLQCALQKWMQIQQRNLCASKGKLLLVLSYESEYLYKQKWWCANGKSVLRTASSLSSGTEKEKQRKKRRQTACKQRQNHTYFINIFCTRMKSGNEFMPLQKLMGMTKVAGCNGEKSSPNTRISASVLLLCPLLWVPHAGRCSLEQEGHACWIPPSGGHFGSI